MKRTTIALGAALILTLAAGGAVTAEDGAFDGFCGDHRGMEVLHQHRMEKLQSFLDLTDQQVEEWRALHEGRLETARSRHEEMQALHERIRELARDDAPDAAAVGELVIEAHRKMEAAEAERDALHAQAMAILTPEQRERFEAIRELHGDRPGRGPRGPGRHMRHHGTP